MTACGPAAERGGQTPVPEHPRQGVSRLVHAFAHAFRGLVATLRSELAFRVEVAAAVVAVPLALALGETVAERGVLLAVTGLVLVVELINAAIETVVDRVGMEHHPLSGRAKDQAAAALLVTLAIAAATWLTVLLG